LPGTAEAQTITGAEVSAPDFIVSAYPNPFAGSSTVKYRVTKPSNVTISVYDASGKQVKVLVNQKQDAGTYSVQWNAGSAAHGIYFINAVINGNLKQSVRISKQ
jgi:flagellar hook assembly protein FlgD